MCSINKEQDRPFSCHLCDKRFTRSENLKRHIKQHSLVKFICPHCEKGYSRNDSLKSHIKRIHSALNKQIGLKAGSSLSLLSNTSIKSTVNTNVLHVISKPTHKENIEIQEDEDRENSENRVEQEESQLEEEDYNFPLDAISKDAVYEVLELYWFNFDPTFPIIHKASFKLPPDYSRNILVNVVCCVGLRYYNGIDKDYGLIADDIYSFCVEQLEKALNNDFTISYFQAALIAVYSGLFSGNDDWYKWSINIHFQLVSLARENGMFQSNASLKIDKDWNTFIITETRRRISYGLYFIDGIMATLFNYPPKLSHYEIKHVLPCSEVVWSSRDSEVWILNVTKESVFHAQSLSGKNSSVSIPTTTDNTKIKEYGLYFLDGLQQTLIKGNAPRSVTSFGGVVILLAIHIMIRNMAQYSGILDQNQPSYTQDPFSRRSQLGQALNALRSLIPKRKLDNSVNKTTNLRTMWDFFETDWNLAYIHLHLPDTVITSGIVEVTLDATIATAAALSKPQLDLVPGTVLLSNDYTKIPYETYALVNSHILFFLKNFKHEFKETNPVFTFMFYKGCLVAWQILKASSTATNALKLLTTNEEITINSSSTDQSSINLEMKKELLQKEYMMKRLADDIVCHIVIDPDYSNKESPDLFKTPGDDIYENPSYDAFNKYAESLLLSYQIWGMGKCASISFTELLTTDIDNHKRSK